MFYESWVGKYSLCPGPSLIFYTSSQPANKKGGAVKSGVTKKGEAAGQLKTSKVVEPEDVEVIVYMFVLAI